MPAPSAGLLVYDGDCGFCTVCAAAIRKHLDPRFSVEPWQSLDLAVLRLNVEDVTTAAWWVDQNSKVHRGHRAIGQALAHSRRRVHRFAGWIVLTPPFSWLGRPIYAVVARYRHKLPGATEACRVDT